MHGRANFSRAMLPPRVIGERAAVCAARSHRQENRHLADVAFLGLGVMGYPMAGHLRAKGGHRVRVYNRTAAKAARWVAEHGGTARGDAAPRREGCDFVFACVGNDDDLRSITLGPEGAFAGMKRRRDFHRQHHRFGASRARTARRGGATRGAFHRRAGFGRTGRRRDGALTVMCGGDAGLMPKPNPSSPLMRAPAG